MNIIQDFVPVSLTIVSLAIALDSTENIAAVSIIIFH